MSSAENILKAVGGDTDEKLLIEEAQRNPARFAQLYENNFDRVYAFVSYRVGSREEAQDLTAEVFHQALVSLGSFEWRGVPFAAWLLGIAAKVLADRWNRLSKRQEVSADVLPEAVANDRIEQRAMIFQLVDSLPADQRQVIMRRFVEQRSVREIAQELGRSEGAVKQLQFRALRTLRERIRSNHG
jgi:RNA polymerase sigma-70 factor (ECF subfamily)